MEQLATWLRDGESGYVCHHGPLRLEVQRIGGLCRYLVRRLGPGTPLLVRSGTELSVDRAMLAADRAALRLQALTRAQ